ncbi:universal stress protein [Streptomyces sp. M19]
MAPPGRRGHGAATGARGAGPAGGDPARRAGEVLEAALRPLASAPPHVPVVGHAVENSPRRALLDASARSDLLVVGARRRRGRFGLQLGLVNHAVLHHAHCPVAVVPQR